MEFMSDNSTFKMLTCTGIMIKVSDITKLHEKFAFMLTYRYKKLWSSNGDLFLY